MKKPIIGIVSKNFDKEERLSVFVSAEMKDAVIDNGGVPIGILPPDKGTHSIKTEKGYTLRDNDLKILIEQINCCDGIILQGGWDSFYYELTVTKYCFDNDIPLLGTCAGQSNMNIAMGGNIKPIDKEKHNKSMDDYVHTATIKPNTKFYDIVGKSEMQVNSSHNNHIDSLADAFAVAALDNDGFPEVIENASKRFCVGVKFHPECLYQKDENHAKIFKAFITACNKGAKNDNRKSTTARL